MTTQLELELQDAKDWCGEVMRLLWRGSLAKFLALERRDQFLDEMDDLVEEIDDIMNLAVSARNLIRESKAIRAMLLDNGFRHQPPKVMQFISNESAIAEELLLVQELKDEKVTRIGGKLKNYNKRLRGMLERRESGFDRMWMDWAGLPTADDFPPSLSLHLLSEFYENDVQLIRRAPDAIEENRHLPGRNGSSR